MVLDLKKMGKIHMIGIGGVSMSGIAEFLKEKNIPITGSDACENQNTKHLKRLGIEIVIGSKKELVKKADTIIYTAAIAKTNPEYVYAQELGKKVLKRSEFLGEITKCFKECICISGTHGKTTTTAMLSLIFLEAKKDPTIQIGAYLKPINGNNKTGKSEYFILEACEYEESFLKFHPQTEIILNIDDDHLDYYQNIQNIKNAFLKFTDCLNKTGTLIANIEDKNTSEIIKKVKHPIITFGLQKNANFNAQNIKKDSYGYYSFDCYKNNIYYDTYTLKILGKHNILNALAAIATSDFYKIDKTAIKNALQNFTGASRRFELIGKYKGICIYDDYAHHPTEIKTTYLCTKEIPHHEVWAVFEPHTYSRTKDHLEEFAHILKQFDHIILSPIYAAREQKTDEISSKDLETLIKKENKNVCFLESYAKIVEYLKENVEQNDIIVTIGAGTINQVGYALLKEK